MLHAHALNIGDAGKVPIGKVKPGVRQGEKQEIGNMDLEAIQKTISGRLVLKISLQGKVCKSPAFEQTFKSIRKAKTSHDSLL